MSWFSPISHSEQSSWIYFTVSFLFFGYGTRAEEDYFSVILFKGTHQEPITVEQFLRRGGEFVFRTSKTKCVLAWITQNTIYTLVLFFLVSLMQRFGE